MSKIDTFRQSWFVFGVVACLTMSACQTYRESQSCSAKSVTGDEAVLQKLHEIIIPELSFRPPATIIDAFDFFERASRDYDKPEIPFDQRGFNFVLKLPVAEVSDTNSDPFAASATFATTNQAPVIPALSARFISLYDAMRLVCDVTGMKLMLRGGLIMIVPMDDPDGELITRTYCVTPSLSECRTTESETETLSNNCQRTDWKGFFTQMGVSWPTGSSIRYLASINRVQITNTRENLEVFEHVLKDLLVVPRLVDIDVQVLAFRTKDINQLQLAGGVSKESLLALQKRGRTKLVATAHVSTKSGQEAVMKAVQEVIYPTELDMDGGVDRSNQVAQVSQVGALMPCHFEMREVGMLLQVVPEVVFNNSALINVILNPQWVTLDRWESYPADMAAHRTHKTLSLREPVFGVTSFQTQVTVADGGTLLLGGSSTPDGEWVHYGFLTVKLIDVQSEQLQE